MYRNKQFLLSARRFNPLARQRSTLSPSVHAHHLIQENQEAKQDFLEWKAVIARGAFPSSAIVGAQTKEIESDLALIRGGILDPLTPLNLENDACNESNQAQEEDASEPASETASEPALMDQFLDLPSDPIEPFSQDCDTPFATPESELSFLAVLHDPLSSTTVKVLDMSDKEIELLKMDGSKMRIDASALKDGRLKWILKRN